MHLFSNRARRRLVRRCAYEMTKPRVRTMIWLAGISAASSLLYVALRRKYP